MHSRIAAACGLYLAFWCFLSGLSHLSEQAREGRRVPSASGAAAPDPSPSPDLAYLKDFDARLTNLASMEEAQKIYDALPLNLDTNFGLECGSRAHVWSWQMKRDYNVDSGKIFLYFTPRSFNHTKMLWGFHVVPYVIVNGQEYVMEKIKRYVVGPGGFYLVNEPRYAHPMPLADWLEATTGFRECNELDNADPAERPWLAYFKTMKMIPDPAANCHLRKAPMEYWWPTSVYNQTFSGWKAPAINRADAFTACVKSMAGRKKRDRETACDSAI